MRVLSPSDRLFALISKNFPFVPPPSLPHRVIECELNESSGESDDENVRRFGVAGRQQQRRRRRRKMRKIFAATANGVETRRRRGVRGVETARKVQKATQTETGASQQIPSQDGQRQGAMSDARNQRGLRSAATSATPFVQRSGQQRKTDQNFDPATGDEVYRRPQSYPARDGRRGIGRRILFQRLRLDAHRLERPILDTPHL